MSYIYCCLVYTALEKVIHLFAVGSVFVAKRPTDHCPEPRDQLLLLKDILKRIFDIAWCSHDFHELAHSEIGET